MRPLALLLLLCAPASAAERLLVVGDSHTAGLFGGALEEALRAEPGVELAVFGVCSARPDSYLQQLEHHCGWRYKDLDGKNAAKWVKARKTEEGKTWVKTPKLEDLVDEYGPDVVVIALGTNGPSSYSSIAGLIAAAKKRKARCAWVGPPYVRGVPDRAIDSVYAELSKAANADSCSIVDSRLYSYLRYPAKGGDGVHYSVFKDLDLSGPASRWGKDTAARLVPKVLP